MTTMMPSATVVVVTAALIILGFAPMCGNAGMCLLTRGQLLSPTVQGQ
jgi:hypothetical protein